MTILKDFSTGYHSRNGLGDLSGTDGDLTILEVSWIKLTIMSRLQRGSVIMDGTPYDQVIREIMKLYWKSCRRTTADELAAD